MQSHGPKRVYTPGSLEFWFGKLEGDWAPAFTAEQLERGRQIYVEGQVRELELTDHDAIVHRRVEKLDLLEAGDVPTLRQRIDTCVAALEAYAKTCSPAASREVTNILDAATTS